MSYTVQLSPSGLMSYRAAMPHHAWVSRSTQLLAAALFVRAAVPAYGGASPCASSQSCSIRFTRSAGAIPRCLAAFFKPFTTLGSAPIAISSIQARSPPARGDPDRGVDSGRGLIVRADTARRHIQQEAVGYGARLLQLRPCAPPHLVVLSGQIGPVNRQRPLLPKLLPNSVAQRGTETDEERSNTQKVSIGRDVPG